MTLLTTTLPEGWRERGHLRQSPAIPERLAVLALRALRAVSHTPTQRVDPERGHQLWRFGWEPGTDCSDHPLCELGRALAHDLPRLLGRPLRLGQLVSDHHKKGAFSDPWDARHEALPLAPLGAPAPYLVALHLVTQPWATSWGGQLLRLDTETPHRGRPGFAKPPEAFAATWNTLDLFDLSCASTFVRPVLEHHVGVTASFTITATLHRA